MKKELVSTSPNEKTGEVVKRYSAEEQKEWDSLYASFRSQSLMTGQVVGVDTQTVYRKGADGKTKTYDVTFLVIIGYRVKILIPETEVWYNERSARPIHVLRSMAGATVDFIITEVNEERSCCLASRRRALVTRRHLFSRSLVVPGDEVDISVLAVGRTHLLATAGGVDFTLSQRDLCYGMIADLRDRFRAGDTKTALVKKYDGETGKLEVSVKEAEPHPFDGADMRHPLNCRRASVITGKYKGGVFCKLEEDLDCICTYSVDRCDEDFHIGDQVIVVVTKYNFEKKQIYGKIITKR